MPAKPTTTTKKEILTLAEADTIAAAAHYPLRQMVSRLISIKAEIASAESELNGEEVRGEKIREGVKDSVQGFMETQKLDTIALENGITISLEDGKSSTVSKELLLQNGVTVEQIAASTVERTFKKLVVRAGMERG